MRMLSWVVISLVVVSSVQAQQRRPRLSETDIADLTKLVMLEDRRDYNEAELRRLLGSANAEIRRRAARSIARINDPRGRALLHAARADTDTSVAATVVFGLGQLRDSAAVPLLGSLLAAPNTPVTVAFEAARALGKIRTPEARDVLARYLSSVSENANTRAGIGEALFSIGRNTARGDIAPIVKFTHSADEETRWRATWALFRPRDPAAVERLMELSRDASGHVRSWAVRGLAAPQVDSSGVSRAVAVDLLGAAVKDSDRRVRTEAVRTLATYDDPASFDVLVAALNDADTWISVSAAEGLAQRRSRADDAAVALTKAASADKPSALRIVAVQSLLALEPQKAAAPAEQLGQDTLPLSQQTARQVAARLNPPPANAQRRPSGGGGNRSDMERPIDTGKTEADYRRIVERWIVSDYNGTPRPRVEWTTPKGVIELELYPGDAPLAVEDFMAVLESGAIIGTEFSRVVPDFVAQQRGIYTDHRLRDEVTRLGLTRGNLSWASAGLDTGRPGYTLGSTAQPHNEGDFTTLGRIVRGLDVVDRLELGDRIIGARRIR